MKETKNGQEKICGKAMEMVKRELKALKAAPLELGISYSRAKRIYQRCQTGGGGAPAHGNKGKVPMLLCIENRNSLHQE